MTCEGGGNMETRPKRVSFSLSHEMDWESYPVNESRSLGLYGLTDEGGEAEDLVLWGVEPYIDKIVFAENVPPEMQERIANAISAIPAMVRALVAISLALREMIKGHVPRRDALLRLQTLVDGALADAGESMEED